MHTVPLLPKGVWIPRVSPETGVQSSQELVSLQIEKNKQCTQSLARFACLRTSAFSHLWSYRYGSFLFPSSCRTSTQPASPWFGVIDILSFSCNFDVVVRGSTYRCIPYATILFFSLNIII
uniref:Uncharacterized protein n=1 Tax=Pipistrellus kuhlii TaxID=59472 RepID=A0A7J8B1I2_PIPKU|nr:hypothetical protein mPipKuh1_007728 [Pipistrellus kuhlii]